MNFKFWGAAIVIGTMVTLPALADENFSNVEQLGNGNDGTVVQGPGSGNQFGTDILAARQSGNTNTLSILQSGSNNEVGTGTSGFLQTSNRNVASITQSSNGNQVLNVVQNGIGDAAFGPDLPRNRLELTQTGGDGNIVLSVTQTRETLFAPVDILPGNTAILEFNGSGNGDGALGATDIAWAWGGVEQATITQSGVTNTLSVTTTGSNNLFGYEQDGEGNGLLASITGDGNETVVLQEGTINIAGFEVTGAGNQVFIQQGDDTLNVAGLSILGDDNQIGLQQFGLANIATLSVDGDNNLLNASQDGSNTLLLNIWGSNNNSAAFTPGEAAGLTAASLSLNPGDVNQLGAGNLITYNVGLSTEGSNNNRFAFSQDGDNNEIVGATFGGTDNEVAIIQNGSNNFTSFSQNGSGNIIGVSQ